MFQAHLGREIQSGSIGAGLATRYNFFEASSAAHRFSPPNSDGSRLERTRQSPLFRREATEFGQELGRYSRGLGCCRGFHLESVCGLVHRGQRLKERVSAGRHAASLPTQASLRRQRSPVGNLWIESPGGAVVNRIHQHKTQIALEMRGDFYRFFKMRRRHDSDFKAR